MESKYFPYIKETIYFEELDNGLKVYLYPKPGFKKNYALFMTKFGSVDTRFKINGEFKTYPAGIAHFLEHKLFESEEGDVSLAFSKNGAETNAFTSFNRTAYLFNSTKDLEENVELLLDFVQNPYFTEETVEKEKGIIKQEIAMYLDEPDSVSFFGPIHNMYFENAIKEDIAGSSESIDQITYDMLYECYEIFYHPSNMAIFISGDFDPYQMIEVVKNNQAKKNFTEKPEIIRYKFIENPKVKLETEKRIMDVTVPKYSIGIKLNITDDYVRKEIALSILFDMLIGKSSKNFEYMQEYELVSSDISMELYVEKEASFAIIIFDSNKQEELDKYIKNLLLNVDKSTLNEENFTTLKRKFIGGYLIQIGSMEVVGNQYLAYDIKDFDFFEFLDVLNSITLEDVKEAASLITQDKITTFFINEKQK